MAIIMSLQVYAYTNLEVKIATGAIELVGVADQFDPSNESPLPQEGAQAWHCLDGQEEILQTKEKDKYSQEATCKNKQCWDS